MGFDGLCAESADTPQKPCPCYDDQNQRRAIADLCHQQISDNSVIALGCCNVEGCGFSRPDAEVRTLMDLRCEGGTFGNQHLDCTNTAGLVQEQLSLPTEHSLRTCNLLQSASQAVAGSHTPSIILHAKHLQTSRYVMCLRETTRN